MEQFDAEGKALLKALDASTKTAETRRLFCDGLLILINAQESDELTTPPTDDERVALARVEATLRPLIDSPRAFLTALEESPQESHVFLGATSAAIAEMVDGVGIPRTEDSLRRKLEKQGYSGAGIATNEEGRAFVHFEAAKGFERRIRSNRIIPSHIKEAMIASVGNGPDVAEVLERAFKGLNPEAMKEVRRVFKAELAISNRKIKDVQIKVDGLEATREEKQYEIDSLMRLKAWFGDERPFILSRNDSTRMHQFLGSGKWRLPGHIRTVGGSAEWDASDWQGYTSFLIQHDWARVFHDAEMPEDAATITPPFEKTALEYRINDITIIHFIKGETHALTQDGEGVIVIAIGFGQDQWMLMGLTASDDSPRLYHYIRKLSDRVLLALDAEVAVGEVVPAPTKLNKKRAEAGKLPINEYRLVKVKPRVRKDVRHRPGTEVYEYKGVVRLHIRRGHWRRYESGTKVWIKSMMVGNPELGFIDHDYSIGKAF